MRDSSIRLYSTIYRNNLGYEDALRYCENGAYITRLDWNGFHYMEGGVYKIMTKEGIILENPKSIYDKDKDDWCVVEITMEALKIMLGEI